MVIIFYFSGVKNKKRVLRKNVIPTRFPWNTKKKSLLKKMGIYVEKKEESSDATQTTEPKSSEEVPPTTSATSEDKDNNTEKMDIDATPMNSVVLLNLDKTDDKQEEIVSPIISTVLQNQDKETDKLEELSSTFPAVPQDQNNTTEKMENAAPAISTVSQEEQKITESQILEAIQAECKVDKTKIRLTKQKNKQLLTLDHFKNDNIEILARTGVESFEKLMAIFGTLGTEVYFLESRRNVISAEDQFFLTMIRLRQNKEDDNLAKLFSITPAVAKNIFITWVDFLYEKWKLIKLSPERVEILVSPHDYLSQSDRSGQKESEMSTDKKGGKGKAKSKKKSDKDANVLPPVPDMIPEGVSKTFTIMQSTETMKHVSKAKLYLVCKILCCFIDNTINPMMCRHRV